MKNRNVVIYIVIAIVLIALILWYLFTPKHKSTAPAPPPQASSVTKTPQPAAVTPPPAPMTTTAVQPAPPPAPVTPPAKPTSYAVVRGDCLWRIAAQSGVYGNPYEWPLIYKANSDKIKDADLIYPGQVLVINHHPSAAAVAAAIRHAKTRGPWSLGKVEASDKAYLAQ